MGILPMSCWIVTQGQDAHATRTGRREAWWNMVFKCHRCAVEFLNSNEDTLICAQGDFFSKSWHKNRRDSCSPGRIRSGAMSHKGFRTKRRSAILGCGKVSETFDNWI
jgi:hypothetical protein